MRALKVLLLSDGRPGHFRLAEGIVAAVGRKRPVQVTRLEVERRALVPARLVSQFVNIGMSAKRVLNYAFGIDWKALPQSDLVVSAGGNTLGANVCATRILRAKNIFYGSLRRFRAAEFSLVMTSYALQVVAPNQMMTLKPSAVDPDEFGRALGDENVDESPPMFGLIIGGDAGTVRYTQEDWGRLFDIVRKVHDQFGARWIVSNSARTPGFVSDRFATAHRDAPTGAIASFIDVRKPNAQSLDVLFSKCAGVLCSADSSSMISEAVWARRKVLAVMPKRFSLPQNEQMYRDWLSQNGWVAEMAIEALEADMFSNEAVSGFLEEVVPIDSNPLDRLSAEIQHRLPGLFQVS